MTHNVQPEIDEERVTSLRTWSGRGVWLALGSVIGATLSTAAAESSHDILYRKLEILAELFGQVESHYVDQVSASDLVYGAAHGLTSVLDPHSAFFPPEEYQELINVTEGEYAGIGVEISSRDGLPEIIAIFDDSPAQRAGIHPGDLILAVDGESVEEMSLDAVKRKLRGPVGTKTALAIRRRGRDEAWRFTLLRRWVRVDPLEHQTLAPGIEYVRIKSFARRVTSDLKALLSRHTPKRGLVLDLRANPGGLFDEAVGVCDLFLESGLIVSAHGRGGRLLNRQTAHRRDTQSGYRLAILIDHGSASAAEVVAGALGDRGRARLFGSRSYGKGSVQSMLDLSDGSGLKLTVARYVTPSGAQIDGRGIEPHVPIDTSDRYDAGDDNDPGLEAAQAWISGG
ncbi:MAG: S41 family peptidase [Myxococcota bacterium]